MSYDELMKKYLEIQDQYEQSEMKNQELKIKNENLTLELNTYRKMIFGSKRESLPKEEHIEEQCSLFDDPKDIEKNVEDQLKENIEKITISRKKKNKNKKTGLKKAQIKGAIIEKEECALNEEDLECPKCNKEMKIVGKKIVRQEIIFEPAKFKIKEYIQYIYKCEKCGTKESENEKPSFKYGIVPKALLPHSIASASLSSEVIYQKYYLGVPLYRQEKMWDDKGLVLPRNVMANWNIRISEYYLESLWRLMLKDIKSSNELIHCDETTMQCNKENGRKASTNSYMWVLRSGELEKKKGVIFKYFPSRIEETAKTFLSNYKGIFVTEGYACYKNIEGITHAECWARMRIYLYESIPLLENKQMDTNATGYTGVLYCDKLFKIEREIALLSVEERQNKSKPILEEFFKWVDKISEYAIVNKK